MENIQTTKTKILTFCLCLKIKSASLRGQQVSVSTSAASSEFDVHLLPDRCCLTYTVEQFWLANFLQMWQWRTARGDAVEGNLSSIPNRWGRSISYSAQPATATLGHRTHWLLNLSTFTMFSSQTTSWELISVEDWTMNQTGSDTFIEIF